MADRYRVTATELNLRSAPVLRPSTRRAVLPHGQLVTKLAADANPDWWAVETVLQGARLEGFVAHRFLTPAQDFTDDQEASGVVPVHLQENRSDVVCRTTSGRAFPLGEPGRPARSGATPAQKATALGAIIAWLAVERSKRFQPEGGRTFCNIYAYDYCYLAGAYLPRVWWTTSAIAQLAQGRRVPVRYGDTVHELNANALLNWLSELGPRFGWQRVVDEEALQAAGNAGQIGIICAQRVDLERPGHIVAVVPETATHHAARTGGRVKVPLQSQAGSVNFRYGAGPVWWRGARFRAHGFWSHP